MAEMLSSIGESTTGMIHFIPYLHFYLLFSKVECVKQKCGNACPLQTDAFLSFQSHHAHFFFKHVLIVLRGICSINTMYGVHPHGHCQGQTRGN